MYYCNDCNKQLAKTKLNAITHYQAPFNHCDISNMVERNDQ